MLAALLSIYKSVPYGYNLDFQEANTQIFDVLNDAAETLEILRDFIEGLELEEEAIRAYVRDKPCWSSDLIELIAVETGKPLRDLYAELARVLHMGAERGGSSLDGFLGKYGIKKDDLLNLYKRKPIEKRLKELLEYASARLQKDLGELERLRSLLIKCNEMLISDSL
uniref:Uncharacterized protein n=1 Tax=Ignisphaera aggregans TaxID=334771 RepID=A0A7C2Z9Q0_9CREN